MTFSQHKKKSYDELKRQKVIHCGNKNWHHFWESQGESSIFVKQKNYRP
jgi:hypothetical protein